MVVVVTGGRWFNQEQFLFDVLDGIHERNEITLLVQGGAKGADAMASKWAVSRRVPQKEYPANWRRYGKRAGVIRNQEMLKDAKPNLVVAFPGGKGTKDCVIKALNMDITVHYAGY